MKSLCTLLAAAAFAFPAFAQQPAAPAAPGSPAKTAEAPAAAAPAKADANVGSQKFGAVCAACHGADGNSGTPANPKLAQQHPEYIVKQLQEFKAGKRQNPIMQGFASQLSEQDMKNIAAFVGSQKAKPGFAKDKALVTTGESIYRGGLGDRHVAACAGCHSPTGAGIPAQYPRLSGQHADYIAAQLRAFRDGGRTNSPQMVAIAARMTDKEIAAVADYIAGLR